MTPFVLLPWPPLPALIIYFHFAFASDDLHFTTKAKLRKQRSSRGRSLTIALEAGKHGPCLERPVTKAFL